MIDPITSILRGFYKPISTYGDRDQKQDNNKSSFHHPTKKRKMSDTQPPADPPAITTTHLTTLLTPALPPPSHISIQDISGLSLPSKSPAPKREKTQLTSTGGCGTSFTATLVSPAFAKKTTLARHRLVNGMLKEEVGRIHAWTVRCYTPEEWEGRREKEGEGER